MIQRTIPTWQALSWQEELKQLITQPEELFEMLELDAALLPDAKTVAQQFPLRTTRSFASRIRKNDVNDPLLRQILPLHAEQHFVPGFSPDPLQEAHFNKQRGIVHKYRNRVLLIGTTSCAIHCRYCFRREFDYANNRMSRADWGEALAYISADKGIDEVILSGGDPLMMNNTQLQQLVAALADIPHVQRLRIHSRLPIVLPARIDDELLTLLHESRLRPVWVLHCNHAQELDTEVRNALRAIAGKGMTLLNQSVLLAGVNDRTETQVALNLSLFDSSVLPYYLFLLDKVSGTGHFDVDDQTVAAIYEGMRARLPGYLLPRLVREEPGKIAKTVILPSGTRPEFTARVQSAASTDIEKIQ